MGIFEADEDGEDELIRMFNVLLRRAAEFEFGTSASREDGSETKTTAAITIASPKRRVGILVMCQCFGLHNE
jgi:hypothetical protein